MTREQREAERTVRVERRRKRKALPGMKREAEYRLKQAVTRALECAATKPQTSDAARAQ